MKQVAGSNTFTYSYQGLNILYEKNVTGGTTTVTKHFYANGLQVAKMVGTTNYYLHQDALGSTRLVATGTVTIKFSSNYVPYGNNYAVSGKEVFMYTGKPQDSSTGLYYMGARYYDTTIGRFVTQDSKAGTLIDPLSLNLYIYARDNPEKYVDPNGHMYSGRMWTDFDDPYVTQTSSCVNGVCTVTTTESYGGYTSTISTATGSMTTSTGTQMTAMSTTVTDEYPLHGVTTVTTTTSSVTTTPTTGEPVTVTRQSTVTSNSDAANAYLLAGTIDVTSGIGLYYGALPLVGLMGPCAGPVIGGVIRGDMQAAYYVQTDPYPTPQGVVENWWTGFWQFTMTGWSRIPLPWGQ